MKRFDRAMRIPNHLGIIPDGNRRWAQAKNMASEKGYAPGLPPGLALFKLCRQIGIREISFYGFTTDNTKRPARQRKAFTAACIKAVASLGWVTFLYIEDCEPS